MRELEILVNAESLKSLRSYPEEPLLEKLVNLEPIDEGLEEFEPLEVLR